MVFGCFLNSTNRFLTKAPVIESDVAATTASNVPPDLDSLFLSTGTKNGGMESENAKSLEDKGESLFQGSNVQEFRGLKKRSGATSDKVSFGLVSAVKERYLAAKRKELQETVRSIIESNKEQWDAEFVKEEVGPDLADVFALSN